MLCAILLGKAEGGNREAEFGLELAACIDVE